MSDFNQPAYVADYHKKNLRRVSFNVNRLTEPELLEHLERQPNIQGYLKDLIRRDMQAK